MICEEIEVGKATGARILNDIRLDTGTLYKGHVITDEDVIMLQIMGIKKLLTAKYEDGDLEQKTAQEIVAAKVCGKDTAYYVGEDGVVKIIANFDGFFVADENRICKFNCLNKNVILNTIPLYSHVKQGEIIAKIEFGLPLFSSEEIDEIVFSLSGNVDLLSVAKPESKRAGVIFTEFYKDKEEKSQFSKSVSKLVTELAGLEINFTKEYFAEHNVKSLADKIEDALAEGNDFIFIVPSLRTIGDDDVIPTAVKTIVDEVVKPIIPNVGISDLIIALKRNSKIVSLPFNYWKYSSKMVDEMLLKVVVNEKISTADFDFDNALLLDGEKGLNEYEKNHVVLPSKKDAKKASVATVILAAGISSRTGVNKLMIDVNGEPLFLKTVKEAVKANTGPVYVVTGYRSEEISEVLEGMDVNIINNMSYRNGVRSSIKLALSHLPSFIDAVILFPADMPNVSASHLNNLVKKLDRRKSRQVIISSYKNVKYNPILWSKELISSADIVPENSDVRPTLIEYEDYTDLVEVKNFDELLDVTYPADIEKARKKTSKK